MTDIKYRGLKKVEIYVLLALSLNIQDAKYLSSAGMVHLSTPCVKSWRSCSLLEDGSFPFYTQTYIRGKRPGACCVIMWRSVKFIYFTHTPLIKSLPLAEFHLLKKGEKVYILSVVYILSSIVEEEEERYCWWTVIFSRIPNCCTSKPRFWGWVCLYLPSLYFLPITILGSQKCLFPLWKIVPPKE